MNSGNLKIILMILFLTVNLYFLHKIVTITESERKFSDTEISEAITLISDKGINVSEENVMKEKKSPKTLKLEWNVQSIDKIAKEIVRSEYGSFKIPNGHSFTSDTERFSVFYDYSFEYSYLDTAENEETAEKAFNSNSSENAKKIKQYGKLLDNLTKKISSKDFNVTAEITSLAESDGKDYIYVTQYVNGCNVNEAGFVAVFEDGNLIFASGKFYFSGRVGKYSTNLYDSINILFQLEPSPTEIIKTDMCYYPISENDTSVYLTPSYKFTYSDDSAVILDATSGIKRK